MDATITIKITIKRGSAAVSLLRIDRHDTDDTGDARSAGTYGADPRAEYLEQCLEYGPELRTTRTALREHCEAWHRSRGFPVPHPRRLGAALRAAGVESTSLRVGGHVKNAWRGVSVKKDTH